MAKTNDARSLVERAIKLRESGRQEEAISVVTELINRFQKAEFYNERGVLYLECANFPNAILDFTDALGIDDSDPDLYTNRGIAYFHLKDYFAALQDLNFAIDLSSDEKQALNCRGQVYFELGDLEASILDFEQAIRLDPDYLSPHFNLARLLMFKGRLSEAREHLDISLKLNPQDVSSRLVSGDLFCLMQQEDLALFEYSRVKASYPNSVPALRRLSLLHSSAGESSIKNRELAIEMAELTCQLTDFKDSECLEALARAYAVSLNFEKAVLYQSTACDIQGESVLDISRSRLNCYLQNTILDE